MKNILTGTIDKYIGSVEKHPVVWGLGAAALTAATIGVITGVEALGEVLRNSFADQPPLFDVNVNNS